MVLLECILAASFTCCLVCCSKSACPMMLSTLRLNSDDLLSQVRNYTDPIREWMTDHPRLALVAVTGGLLATYISKEALSRPANLPPGPRGLPFLGNRHQLDFTKIHEDFAKIGQKYGDVFTVYVFDNPFVILNSVSAIKEGFVSDRYLMAGRPPADDYLAVMNEEIFMADYSEPWKQAKKSGMLALRKFAGPQSSIDDVMLQEVEYLIDTFTKSLGKPFDAKPVFYKSTSNILAKFMFGIHYEDHDHPELQKLRDGIYDWYWSVNGDSPWDQFYPPWLLKILTAKSKKVFRRGVETLREYTLMIMDRIQDTYDPENPKSFLEFFMATRDMDAMGGRDAFADTIDLYCVDPVDTMTLMLQWSLLYLAYFPEEQKKLQKLIDQVVGRGSLVRSEHRTALGLVESFLHEMRRHSNFTSLSFAHSVTRDNVNFRGYTIPRDVPIFANFYAIHMDPAVHPEPEKFKPERFVDKEGKFIKADTVGTFSFGSRSCPGDIHSRLELFLTVVNIAHHFNIDFPDGVPKPKLKMQDKSFFKFPHDFEVVFTQR